MFQTRWHSAEQRQRQPPTLLFGSSGEGQRAPPGLRQGAGRSPGGPALPTRARPAAPHGRAAPRPARAGAAGEALPPHRPQPQGLPGPGTSAGLWRGSGASPQPAGPAPASLPLPGFLARGEHSELKRSREHPLSVLSALVPPCHT